jgi:MATE family multidrug resistance protein
LLALALPAALLFTAYRGFNVAVSRPKAVMALQLGALALKVPLSMLLIHGQRELRLPALGVAGAALATVIVMWLQLAAAWLALRRDRFYRRFALRGLGRPERKPLAALLRLGVPMGLSILVEVSGFTMMAIFIARLGTTPVAAHQLVANLASVLFMMPLALANATGTLVAQNVGAGDLAAARRIGWHGIAIACAVALAMSSAVFTAREPILRLYTNDAVVIGAALPLLAWFVVFHVADAAQAVAAFVLRAWRIAVVPMLIYAAAAWLLGLGGGTLLGFDVLGNTPRELTGAAGYWFAASAGMVAAALALAGFLQFVMRTKVR